MPENKKNSFFWILVAALYIASIGFSYIKIYVHQDYPIFYTEEDLPDAFDILRPLIQ